MTPRCDVLGVAENIKEFISTGKGNYGGDTREDAFLPDGTGQTDEGNVTLKQKNCRQNLDLTNVKSREAHVFVPLQQINSFYASY